MTIIDLTKIIELKKVLNEHFNTILHIHDCCAGQYFGVENLTPAGKDYIINFFNKYSVIFNDDNTEFHLEDIELC